MSALVLPDKLRSWLWFAVVSLLVWVFSLDSRWDHTIILPALMLVVWWTGVYLPEGYMVGLIAVECVLAAAIAYHLNPLPLMIESIILVQMRRQSQVYKAQAQRELVQLKAEFLAHISHELRTPLNGILGGVRLLSHDMVPDPNQKTRVLQTINTSASKLLRLVNDLIDLTRLSTGQFSLNLETFDPQAICQEVVLNFMPEATQKGLMLCLIDSPTFWVVNDPTRLSQILHHLLDNSLKFTETGEIQIKVFTDQQRWGIQVMDTGIGMSEAALKHIFEPFYQADSSVTRCHNGCGIGLTLVQRLVQAMDGVIQVSSQLGKGCWVQVTFDHRHPTESKERL